MPLRDDQIAQVLAPIGGPPLTASELRDDPAYHKVRTAQREDPDLPQGALARERKMAEPAQVISGATDLLARKAKDLQLAAWLAEALLKRDGFGGFAQGLAVIRDLVANQWDVLVGDADLRAGPLDWLGGKLDVPVRQVPITRGGYSYVAFQTSRQLPTEAEAEGNRDKRAARDTAAEEGRPLPDAVDKDIEETPKAFYASLAADLDACVAAVTALELDCDRQFVDDAPAFGRLRGALEEVRRFVGPVLARKRQLEPDPPPVATAETVAPPPAAGGREAGDWSLDGARGSQLDGAHPESLVATAAHRLRGADPTSPVPYLLLRALRWGELRRTPGTIDPRLLEAPPTALRTQLKQLFLASRWAELLELGEGVMAAAHGRGWLDLQRYTVTACEGLGAAYDPAAAAVRDELRVLLRAAPWLPEATLMDETPTANAETRAWLVSSGVAAPGQPASNGADQLAPNPHNGHGDMASTAWSWENGAPPPRRDAMLRARAELEQGRPNRAIGLLVEELAREQSPRGRFLRQTQIASVMVGAGLEGVAQPILEQLLEQIEEHKLEAWEAGDLVAEPLVLLCRCIDKLDGDQDERQKLYLRVCRLDPLQAIALHAAASG